MMGPKPTLGTKESHKSLCWVYAYRLVAFAGDVAVLIVVKDDGLSWTEAVLVR